MPAIVAASHYATNGSAIRVRNHLLVSPKDVLASTMHLLGIDPNTLVADIQGRPLRIAGDVRTELLG